MCFFFSELSEGLTLVDQKGEERGKSRLAALKAITLVIISRNVIAAPAMRKFCLPE